MRACKRCLLSENVPGSDIDASGVCAFCNSYSIETEKRDEEIRREREKDLLNTLRQVREKSGYQALVCLSGGKDSLYLLYKLAVEYKLKVLAFTTDVNIPEIAWKNIKKTVDKLQIDHLIYRPKSDFYRKLFRYLLQNQEERGAVYTVSYVYAPLFEGDALHVAIEKNIPLIAAGYSPGQPERERMIYEFSPKLLNETDWTPPGLKASGQFTPEELSRFWNPYSYPKGTKFPRYLAPFHAWEYNQEEIMKKVVDLGLVEKKTHASPILSNYPINWLLMYSDLIHFGYNPYQPEFSALIRSGKASKRYWKIAQPVINYMIRNQIFLGKEVKRQLDILKLSPSDLKINCPRGTYDPPIAE